MSVLHAAHAAEILIKARIAAEHPLVVFAEISRTSIRPGQPQYVSPLALAGASQAGEARQVSAGGVGGIVWRDERKELFYLAQPGQIMTAVELDGAGGVRPETRTPLFKLPTPILAVAQLSSVASPDGQRFAFAVTVTRQPPAGSR